MADVERNRLNSETTDDIYSEDEQPPLLPPPPDGGYGWVIVFASFMCNMIVDGIAYTFGMFLGEFVTYFGEGKGTIAWVGSLLSGMYLSAGPVVSALANKYGCRAVCISGAIIASSAFVLSTFSTSVTMLMLTYGLLGGIGFGMIYLPAVVAVGYYFETKRSLATGIAVCGSGVGTFAFAPFATYLLDKFDWKNALLILAGLILNCAVFGAMMRPLTFPKEDDKKHKSLMQRMYEEKKAQLERGSIGGSFFMVQLPDGTMEKRMKLPANIDPGVHSSLALDLLAQQQYLMPSVPTLPTISETKPDTSNITSPTRRLRTRNRVSESEVSEANPHKFTRNSSQPSFPTSPPGIIKNVSTPAFERIRKISVGDRFKPSLSVIRADSKDEIKEYDNDIYNSRLSVAVPTERTNAVVSPFARKDIFYSGSITNLKEYQSQKSLHGYRFSVLSFAQYEREKYLEQVDSNVGTINTEPTCCSIPSSFKTTINTMLDFNLLKDAAFMCIGISNVFGMAGLYVPFVYLVDAAVKDGIPQNSASLLLSIIGIVNTFGRILCGYIADFPQVDSLLLNNMCLLMSTVAVAATPFCSSYISYIFVAIFFGIAISGYISLTSIILVDLLGLDKLTNAFGLLILFRGAATIVGSPLAGLLYDLTLSYDIPFFVAGAFFGMSAITSFLAPLAKNLKKDTVAQIQLDVLAPIDEEPYEYEDDDQPITLKPKLYDDISNNCKSSTTPNDLNPIFEIDENNDRNEGKLEKLTIIQNESVL